MIKDLAPLALSFCVLFGVSHMPPDNALAEVQELGRLRVCVPQHNPPLVTEEPEYPGFEVELLAAVAETMGLRLELQRKAEMGGNYDPRSWRITRAQCHVLAGGVAATVMTRAFLETSQPVLTTGWSLIAKPGESLETLVGPVGFYPGGSNLDRLALGQYLRGKGIRVQPVTSREQLLSGLAEGRYAAAISDILSAQQAFSDEGLRISPLSSTASFGLGFGFWKGDLTLKRAVSEAIQSLRVDGTLANLARKYRVTGSLVCQDEPSCAGA